MSDIDENILLAADGLCKRFPVPGTNKVVHACEDISLAVSPGKTLGVIGESGSGKTTLGRCLLRLIEPTEGSIRFNGTEVARLPRKAMNALRTDMQIVFQEPFDSMNPQMTIGRQLAEPLRIHSDLSKDERKARVSELLALVGLPETVAGALPRMLSPGALQRASIARAIATEPSLVVLDEPTSALAPEAEAEVMALLESLRDRLGLAFVFISHDLSLVSSMSDDVIVMYLGQVVERASSERLFSRPSHPYSAALLASVLTPDPSQRSVLDDTTLRLEGEIPSPIDLPRGCFLASRCPFATERCRTESQVLQTIADRHETRCWRVAEGDLTTDELAHMAGRPTASTQANA